MVTVSEEEKDVKFRSLLKIFCNKVLTVQREKFLLANVGNFLYILGIFNQLFTIYLLQIVLTPCLISLDKTSNAHAFANKELERNIGSDTCLSQVSS